METFKIKRKITSSQIRIPELNRFIGKQVEITVTEKKTVKRKTIKDAAAGILEQFKNPEYIISEKDAWEMAVNEKYGNYRR